MKKNKKVKQGKIGIGILVTVLVGTVILGVGGYCLFRMVSREEVALEMEEFFSEDDAEVRSMIEAAQPDYWDFAMLGVATDWMEFSELAEKYKVTESADTREKLNASKYEAGIKNYNYLFLGRVSDSCSGDVYSISSAILEKSKLEIEFLVKAGKGACDYTVGIYIVSVPKAISLIEQIDYTVDVVNLKNLNTMTDDKPIIYLYPEGETEVSVRLGSPEKLSVSYPKYKEEGWKVLARPGGELVDLETGRELYSLYWEGKGAVSGETDEGFVVRGEDSAGFLEEKLAILGLNEREAEEFIIYWLPKLEANEYNYIRFATDEEIEEYMPLSVLPEPDSVVRVNMLFKGVGEDFRVQEQRLETPERDGFVVVEWGGSELE